MDVEEFIEQDILVFLDERLDRKFDDPTERQSMKVESVYLSRDYEEEIYNALENDNVTLAKHVLHDLREKFEEIPPNSPDKHQVKALLAHLYELFRRHVSGEKVERPEEPFQKPEHKTATPETHVQEPEKEPEVDNTPQVEHLLSRAELFAGEGRFREAIQEYRRAKSEVVTMKTVPASLAKEFKDTYGRIQELLKESKAQPRREEPELVEEPEEPQEEQTQKEVSHETLDKEIIMQLEKEKHVMDSLLHQHQVAAAMKSYQRMKTLVQQIKNPAKAERMAAKLVQIYNIIKSIKNSPVRHP